jgi:hypothetical protein
MREALENLSLPVLYNLLLPALPSSKGEGNCFGWTSICGEGIHPPPLSRKVGWKPTLNPLEPQRTGSDLVHKNPH